MDSLLAETLHWITRGIEVAGVMVILAGLAAGTIGYLTGPRDQDPEERFRLYRARLGRSILLGLEFLVAADIVNTVAVEPSLRSLAVLGGIVAAILGGTAESYDERLSVVFMVLGLGMLGTAVTLLADEVRIVRQQARDAVVRPQWVEATAGLVNGLTPARLLMLGSIVVLVLAAYVGRS